MKAIFCIRFHFNKKFLGHLFLPIDWVSNKEFPLIAISLYNKTYCEAMAFKAFGSAFIFMVLVTKFDLFCNENIKNRIFKSLY